MPPPSTDHTTTRMDNKRGLRHLLVNKDPQMLIPAHHRFPAIRMEERTSAVMLGLAGIQDMVLPLGGSIVSRSTWA